MPSEVGSTSVEALRGGAASAGACLFSNPIDVVRVRLQLGDGRGIGGSASAVARSLFQAGLTSSLGSSLPTAMAYNVTLNSARFALFHALHSSEDGMLHDRPISSGLAAGGIAGFLSSPLARLRTLQQAGGHTTASAVRALAAAPFEGATLWSLRNAGHTACIFCLYQTSVTHLESAQVSGSPSVLHLAASLFAASVSCVLMNPLDVLATRAFHTPALPRPIITGGSLGSPSGAASGSRALLATAYRGLGVNLLRTVPHTVLTFVFLEALRGKSPLLPTLRLPAVDSCVDSARARLCERPTDVLPAAFGAAAAGNAAGITARAARKLL